jgi:hypothetical protein
MDAGRGYSPVLSAGTFQVAPSVMNAVGVTDATKCSGVFAGIVNDMDRRPRARNSGRKFLAVTQRHHAINPRSLLGHRPLA